MKTLLLAILTAALLIAPASRLAAVCQDPEPPKPPGNEGSANPSPSPVPANPTPTPTPAKPNK